MKSLTIRELLRSAANQLILRKQATNLDDGLLQVELLFGLAASLKRSAVLALGSEEPTIIVRKAFQILLDRRLGHEPLAYILGEKEFFGLPFRVGTGVLVPRPETEILVEIAIERGRTLYRRKTRARFADIGTGSGILAICLSTTFPDALIHGIDISDTALHWAKDNANRLTTSKTLTFSQGSLLEPLKTLGIHDLDILVANLPYIPSEEVLELPEEIRQQEPLVAIDGGVDGLELYRALSRQLKGILSPDGAVILLEVGNGQISWVEEIMKSALKKITSHPIMSEQHRDMRKIRRVLEIRYGTE
jgi:release factor glutamine methyltransferase